MSGSNFVLGLLLSSLLALAPTPGLAQLTNKTASSLTGTVFAEGGDRRIENASVALCDDQGNCLQETLTNGTGEFSFSGIRPWRYVLRVRAEGFVTAEQHVDLTLASLHGLAVGLSGAVQTGAAPGGSATVSAHELSIPSAARESLRAGMLKLYKEKNAQAALSDFQTAIKKAPGYYEAYYQVGMAYLALQRDADAEKQLRKSVELSQTKYGDAAIALGTLLLRRQEETEGEHFLRQGLAMNPQSWPGLVEVGKLELARGRLDLALAAAEKAESLAPLQPMVYRLLALVHLKQKDFPALLSDLDNYIRLDPDSPASQSAKKIREEVERQISQSAAAAPAK